MGRFNLLDEKWIPVLVDDKGRRELVSLLDVFKEAPNYRSLAGDMATQDFAVFRLLLAVLHTVFSRVDAQGEVYEWLDLDEAGIPAEPVEEDEAEDYREALYDTWTDLWEAKRFGDAVTDYLIRWRDRFYLFDEDYPFFQVRREDVDPSKLNSNKPTPIYGKNINRLISESENKTALFPPKSGSNDNKEILNEAEVARWLITYQAYSNQSDKSTFKDTSKSSKGWLFELGGIMLNGDNLFETLLLNLALVRPDQSDALNIQRPCWEYKSEAMLNRYLASKDSPRIIDNLAELYTLWSRAIYMDPVFNLNKPFFFEVVKLPDVMLADHFIEPMTLWEYNKKGPYKGHFTPKKHQAEESLWHSYGLLSGVMTGAKSPGIIQWVRNDHVYPDLINLRFNILAVSMIESNTKSSQIPVNEVVDHLIFHERLLTDTGERGWDRRINDTVEKTNDVVKNVFGRFMYEVKAIRNLSDAGFTAREVAQLYYALDEPFRRWLQAIEPEDDQDAVIRLWYEELRTIVKAHADAFVAQASPRDFTGRIVSKGASGEEKGVFKNIATAYESFLFFLNRALPKKKEETHG